MMKPFRTKPGGWFEIGHRRLSVDLSDFIAQRQKVKSQRYMLAAAKMVRVIGITVGPKSCETAGQND